MLQSGPLLSTLLRPYNAMVRFLFNLKSLGRKEHFAAFVLRLQPSVKTYGALVLVVLPLIVASGSGLAATTITLLPWQLIGWDAEFPTRHRTRLQAAHQAIEQAWMSEVQSLDRWAAAQGRELSLNQQRRAASLRIGTPRQDWGFSAYIVPILCPVGSKIVFALEIVDLSSQLLLDARRVLIDPTPATTERLIQISQESLVSRLAELIAEAPPAPPTAPADAMKLRLSLLRGGHDSRQGAHLCLNMLLAHSLIDEQRVLATSGQLEALMLRHILGVKEAPQRFTRILALDWGQKPSGPARFPYTARWDEGVLAGALDLKIKGEISLQEAPAGFKPPADLLALLRSTQQQLLLGDAPQVSRIRGAWVYLDRGRAWGLDMDDRLYLDDGQRLIKGHVVGFFGPGLGLKSPRGYAIQEGAIVYIRKGQRDVKVGDLLQFDPTRFPTPWPPVRQPQPANATR